MWSSRWLFVLAAAGSAVGIGNIWKFPYVAGQNGGGAFVIIYLVCVAVVGIPIMMSEVMLGREGRTSPVNTMRLIFACLGGHAPRFLEAKYFMVQPAPRHPDFGRLRRVYPRRTAQSDPSRRETTARRSEPPAPQGSRTR